MFRHLDGSRPEPGGILIFEGRDVPFRAGDSVAAALLAAGVVDFRDHPVDRAPRGPFCLMGVCFECLVEIDGRANRQGCVEPARDGMIVARSRGARRPA